MITSRSCSQAYFVLVSIRGLMCWIESYSLEIRPLKGFKWLWRAKFSCAPVGYAGPTLQLTGLKTSITNLLVPDTTAHHQRSCGVHASMGQNCFGRTRGTLWLTTVYYQCFLFGDMDKYLAFFNWKVKALAVLSHKLYKCFWTGKTFSQFIELLNEVPPYFLSALQELRVMIFPRTLFWGTTLAPASG